MPFLFIILLFLSWTNKLQVLKSTGERWYLYICIYLICQLVPVSWKLFFFCSSVYIQGFIDEVPFPTLKLFLHFSPYPQIYSKSQHICSSLTELWVFTMSLIGPWWCLSVRNSEKFCCYCSLKWNLDLCLKMLWFSVYFSFWFKHI